MIPRLNRPARHIVVFALLFIALLLCVARAASAQTPDADDPEAARIEAELRVEADMVKMNNLVEALAKNLGQLHYLRTLCFGLDDQKWRNYANNMMSLETEDNPARRTSLVQAFNAGFYLEKDRYDKCTEAVSLDVAALAENGRSIAVMLGDPYREN